MRVLWINNIAIPQIAKKIGITVNPFCGWMVRLADEISESEDIDLTIAFPHSKNISGRTADIKYMSFSIQPRKVHIGNLGGQDIRIREIIKTVSPDVIHIFGTEYVHTYITTEVCKEMGLGDKVVISIQGLVSVCAKHFDAYLDHSVVVGKTLRDLYKGNIKAGKKAFQKRGMYEIAALHNVRHVIGRTDWDRACVGFINPKALYHFNNEMLRSAFYRKNKWDSNKCEKYSIFMRQATLSYKGLHIALEAISTLIKDYPCLKLYVAGKSYYKKPKWKLSYYEKYILEYIKKNNLQDRVIFTGFLDEDEMYKRYIQSNIFVSASSIENSPNSVCEAMILGVPVISSMVGGMVDLLEHGVNGFYYQADAPYMLRYYIKKIFEDTDLAKRISKNEIETAEKRHDRADIIKDLKSIYESINK